jgi:hypothetical protein
MAPSRITSAGVLSVVMVRMRKSSVEGFTVVSWWGATGDHKKGRQWWLAAFFGNGDLSL